MILQDESNVSIQDFVERENRFRQIIEYSFEPIVVHADQIILFINEPGARFLRGTKEQLIGANIVDVFEDKPLIIERIEKGMTTKVPAEIIEQTIFRLDGTKVEVELYCHPFTYGDRIAIQSSLRDISKRKETERQLNQALHEIQELSSPIVPLSPGMAVLPLIGSINECRARQLLDDIPVKVQKANVQSLIIDFSGIYNMDAVVTNTLFKITTVLQLLGVGSIITGIRPEHAQAAIENGIDLSSIRTMTSVMQALEMVKQ